MVISLVRRGPQWPTHLPQEWRWQKDQLRSGTRSVGEIALAIGFQSSSAFTTAFTRIVGCPPTQFLAERLGGLFSEEASS
jgi:AraC-like DNA-binding protein